MKINTDNPSMLLAVAPNGARKQYADHPALPITPIELAKTAESCLAAGARMMHVHVRDESNHFAHCLDAQKYYETFQIIREVVGEQLFLQATTEAVGLYSADEQMAMVRELAKLHRGQGVFGVSLGVRELMAESVPDAEIKAFFEYLRDEQILPQLIVYDVADCLRFQDLLQRGVLVGEAYPCLFVLGRYREDMQSVPADLIEFFSHLTGVSSWMGCAFGRKEAQVAKTAALLGGHMRIGYENNTLLADGRQSLDNAELIAQTAAELPDCDRLIATVEEAVALLTPRW